MPESPYSTLITRGHTAVNDRIIDYLKPRIIGRFLDVGCNAGWLLSELPGGIGIDASPLMVAAAHLRGLEVILGDAERLPFRDGAFETVVLSCVLEQCAHPERALSSAICVGGRVIGINPIPQASPWGHVGGWVRSVISEDFMCECGFRTERIDNQRYYFESK